MLENWLEQLRRAGEPMLPADFAPPKIDQLQNGAVDLDKAARTINRNSPAWKAYNELQEPVRLPLRTQEREAVQGILADSTEALALIEQAKADFTASRTYTIEQARALSDAFIAGLRAKYPTAP